MDRPDPGPARRARRASSASTTFPTHGEGHNVIEYGGHAAPLQGHDPAHQPVGAARRRAAQRRLNRLSRSVPLHAPWEAPNAARLDGQTAATWMRRNLATKGGRTLLELGIEAVWAAQPEDMSLLHVLFYIHSAGSLELLFDTEGGAQQDRFVGGSQLIPIRMADALGDERLVLGAPVRRIEHGAERRHRARRRQRAARPARDRRGGAHARGADRLRPAAPRLPRPAHPADAARHGRQVHGDLRRAVLARRRPVRPGHERPRARAPDLRQLAAGRLAGRAARLPRGSARARARPRARRRAANCGDRLLHAPVRPARGARPTPTSSGSGRRRSGRAAATAATCPPAPGPTTARRCAQPIGPLHWAGAEYAHVWNGYMDGAVRSGEATAAEVSRLL